MSMKLVTTARSRSYELTYLVPATYTETERQAVDQDIKALLTKHSATLGEVQDWGRRPLAYAIRYRSANQSEAYYTHLTFTADPAHAQALEKDIYLHDRIMRHLLVLAAE
jgi:small subunit ribosomal protein S6